MAAVVATGSRSSAKKKLFPDGDKDRQSAPVITATRKEDAGDAATSLTGQLGRTLKISQSAKTAPPRTSPIKLGKRASLGGNGPQVEEGATSSDPKRHKPPSPSVSKASGKEMKVDEVILENFSWPQSNFELTSAAAIPAISQRLKKRCRIASPALTPPRRSSTTGHWRSAGALSQTLGSAFQVKKIHCITVDWHEDNKDEGNCAAILADVAGFNKSFAAWANAPIVPPICFTYEGAPVSFTRKEQPLTLLFTPDGIDQLPGYTVVVAEWSTAVKAQEDGADISDTTILPADFNIDTMSDVFGSLHLYLPNVLENDLPEVLKIAGITAEVVARTNNKGKNTGLYTLLVRGYEGSKPACLECQVLSRWSAYSYVGPAPIFDPEDSRDWYLNIVPQALLTVDTPPCNDVSSALLSCPCWLFPACQLCFSAFRYARLASYTTHPPTFSMLRRQWLSQAGQPQGAQGSGSADCGQADHLLQDLQPRHPLGQHPAFLPPLCLWAASSDPAELLVTSAFAGTTPIEHFRRAMIATGDNPDKLVVSRQWTTNFVSISVGDPALAVRLACAGAMLDAHRHVPLTLSHFAKSNIAGAKSGDNLLNAVPFLATQFEQLRASLSKPAFYIEKASEDTAEA